MKLIRSIIAVALLFSLLSAENTYSQTYENRGSSYPTQPNVELTPGDLCDKPSELRYPERIKYCRRDVETRRKWEIIYDYEKLGYKIADKRGQFKIDHYIPLCMGGGNDDENLWPQHKTVYEVTDPLEHLLCEKLKAGRILQSDAIDKIRHGKNNLSEVKRLIQEVNAL